ncbi:MAG: hypothetical protein GPOALKHO_000144 [Sodalis sp.]|nr:MAG: hypothetical protein GPOALKHO_000144 [Sodalis sp.]
MMPCWTVVGEHGATRAAGNAAVYPNPLATGDGLSVGGWPGRRPEESVDGGEGHRWAIIAPS